VPADNSAVVLGCIRRAIASAASPNDNPSNALRKHLLVLNAAFLVSSELKMMSEPYLIDGNARVSVSPRCRPSRGASLAKAFALTQSADLATLPRPV
jgi:hypothetical protein